LPERQPLGALIKIEGVTIMIHKNDLKKLKRPRVLLAVSLIILLCAFNSNIIAQSDSGNLTTGKIRIGLGPGIIPSYILKMDTVIIGIDTTVLKKLNSSWIKKVKILKDFKYKNLYSSPENDAAILITIKKRYIPLVKEILKI
jgi:hypothetical protein